MTERDPQDPEGQAERALLCALYSEDLKPTPFVMACLQDRLLDLTRKVEAGQ